MFLVQTTLLLNLPDKQMARYDDPKIQPFFAKHDHLTLRRQGGGVQGQILDFLGLDLMLKPCLSSFQNGLTFFSTSHGCRDMTRRSWPLRARFRKNVWKNPKKLGLIFHAAQFFEPLGGQLGLKIGMYLQSNDIQGIASAFLDFWIFWPVLGILAQIWGSRPPDLG